jgi:glycosyltransferase involved in cell wall biosynthesis
MLSLLIPVYNEEGAVEATIRDAHAALTKSGEPFEIVVIEDGCTDKTQEILQSITLSHVRIIHHPINRGYGASLKTGIRRSKGELIATTDADGTYPVAELPAMLAELKKGEADMVIGARTKKGVQIPLIRRPAKAVVSMLANILTGMKIPDVNSGLRVFRRELGERFMHLYPQRFSFAITITLAGITSDYIVLFHPIDYFKRTGNSSLSAGFNGLRNFIGFLGIIVRIVTYFRPLKFFAWPSVLIMLAGLGLIVHTVRADSNVSDAGLLLMLSGIQIGLFGLLAEVVVRSRQQN